MVGIPNDHTTFTSMRSKLFIQIRILEGLIYANSSVATRKLNISGLSRLGKFRRSPENLDLDVFPEISAIPLFFE